VDEPLIPYPPTAVGDVERASAGGGRRRPRRRHTSVGIGAIPQAVLRRWPVIAIWPAFLVVDPVVALVERG
jgi:hypothetical protein